MQLPHFRRALREKLGRDGWQVGRPRIAQVFSSVDGTERYLVQGQGVDGADGGDGLDAGGGWGRGGATVREDSGRC